MTHSRGVPELPGRPGSCWVATQQGHPYPRLKSSAKADVAVIGAGIVGLTAANQLTKAGLSVVVVEARTIGEQVTGRSTAKITTQHGLVYKYLVEKLGFETAKKYAEANHFALGQMRSWIEELGIACDFETKAAYVYCCDPKHITDLEEEAAAARQVGLEAEVCRPAPLPFETVGALRFRGQAQFNPAKYLVGLASAAKAGGASIYENARVTNVENDGGWIVTIGNVTVKASHVVLGTNIPTWGPVPFDERTRPRCHIAMAFRTEKPIIDGMFIGMDDPHSLRTGSDDTGHLLVALGPKFETGQEGDVAKHFFELEAWTRRNLGVGDVAWRWVNEDYDTADRVPYAGALKSARGLYVATGFNAWGISNGTAAGMLIANQVLGQPADWDTIYDPERKGERQFNKGGESQSLVHSLDDVPPGEGRIISVGKGKLAVYRNKSGKLHALSAACTHKGCDVTWNNADGTWDCPCHGSMFSVDGTVLHGPAVEPLPAKKLPANWLGKVQV